MNIKILKKYKKYIIILFLLIIIFVIIKYFSKIESFKVKDNVAIIFSGHLRTYKDCFPTYKKNIYNELNNKYNIDVYCHLWDNEEENIDEALKLYKPINYNIDKQINYKLPGFCNGLNFHYKKNHKGNGKFPYNTITGIINQHYGLNISNSLSKNKDYKYKFRIRYDNLFESKLDINDLSKLNNNEIYIGNGHTKYLNGLQTNINDAFAYGKSTDMDKYFSFYKEINNILKKIKDKKLEKKYKYLYDNISITLLFKYYMDIKKIKCNVSNIKFGLKRNKNITYFQNCKYDYKGKKYIIN